MSKIASYIALLLKATAYMLIWELRMRRYKRLLKKYHDCERWLIKKSDQTVKYSEIINEKFKTLEDTQ